MLLTTIIKEIKSWQSCEPSRQKIFVIATRQSNNDTWEIEEVK